MGLVITLFMLPIISSKYYLKNISSNYSKPVFPSQAFSTLACGEGWRRWTQTFDGSNIHRIFLSFNFKNSDF